MERWLTKYRRSTVLYNLNKNNLHQLFINVNWNASLFALTEVATKHSKWANNFFSEHEKKSEYTQQVSNWVMGIDGQK